MKGMNRNSQHLLHSIIHNRIVLYVIVFASLMNMTAYGLMGDIMTPLVFILVGVITAYYNKNMIVVLVVALAVSNVMKYGSQITMSLEGFTEGMDGDSKSADDEKLDIRKGVLAELDKVTKDTKTSGDNNTAKTSGDTNTTNTSGDSNTAKTSGDSNTAKTSGDSPTMTTEEEEKSLKEFEEMKSKIIEIVDTVELNIDKINKKMKSIQDKIAMKEKEAYGSK
jgi:hypothetical protein